MVSCNKFHPLSKLYPSSRSKHNLFLLSCDPLKPKTQTCIQIRMKMSSSTSASQKKTNSVHLINSSNNAQSPSNDVMFFDIDNCLYHRNSGIEKFMKQKITEYGIKVGIPIDDVVMLTSRYTKDYGLAIRGLIQHHEVDPIDYDINVDQSLPIEDLISRDEAVIDLVSRCTARRWAFTNAMLPHASRVLKTLGVYDLLEGIIYTDYSEPNFPCKPDRESYERAMRAAGVSEPQNCFLVDDSLNNILAAKKMGWTAILVSEDKAKDDVGDGRLDSIYGLDLKLPQIFSLPKE